MNEKLELVHSHRTVYGLNACLRALGVSKGTWHYRMGSGSKKADREARDDMLKSEVVQIVKDHPSYGYRRIRPDLEEATGKPINDKRLRRLLRTWDLALHRVVSRPKPSGIEKVLSQAKGHLDLTTGITAGSLELLSTDFTEIPYCGGRRKAYLMAMVDVESCWVPGWAVGLSADRTLALRCWKEVKGAYLAIGAEVAGTIIHHDRDPVYRSHDWLHELLVRARVRVSYSERGARDNPWIESFWSRFKQENASLLIEARDLEDLTQLIDQQMKYYNHLRWHSRLGNQPPLAYLYAVGIGLGSLSSS